MMDSIVVLFFLGLILFILLIKGVIRTFQRNAVVAILMIIFLFPIYLVWAFVEIFLE